MQTWLANLRRLSYITQSVSRSTKLVGAALAVLVLHASTAFGQPAEAAGEASLQLPDLRSVSFLGFDGHTLLLIGLVFCLFGLAFGLAIYLQLKNAPVHRSMREISELIYETCKTYLVTQGKFILILEAFIAVVIVLYFGVLEHLPVNRVIIMSGRGWQRSIARPSNALGGPPCCALESHGPAVCTVACHTPSPTGT